MNYSRLDSHKFVDGLDKGFRRKQYQPFYALLTQWMHAKELSPYKAEDRTAFLTSLGLEQALNESEFATLFPTGNSVLSSGDTQQQLPTKAVPGKQLLFALSAQLPGSVFDLETKLSPPIDRLELINRGSYSHGPDKKIVDITAEALKDVCQKRCDTLPTPDLSGVMEQETMGEAEGHELAQDDAQVQRVQDLILKTVEEANPQASWEDVQEYLQARYTSTDARQELIADVVGALNVEYDEVEKWASQALPDIDQHKPYAVGQHLKALRHFTGYTQQGLADELQVSVFTMNDLESGRNQSIRKYVGSICNALGLNELGKSALLFRVLPALNPEWLDAQAEDKRAGLLLAAYRNRVGVDQEDLASALGVSLSVISKLESGYNQSIHKYIGPISKALGLHEPEQNALLLRALPALNLEWLDAQTEDNQAGLLLAAYRNRAGVEQDDLASALGVQGSTISHLESGRNQSIGRYMTPISDALDLTSKEAEYLNEKAQASKEARTRQVKMKKVNSMQSGSTMPAKKVPELAPDSSLEYSR